MGFPGQSMTWQPTAFTFQDGFVGVWAVPCHEPVVFHADLHLAVKHVAERSHHLLGLVQRAHL